MSRLIFVFLAFAFVVACSSSDDDLKPLELGRYKSTAIIIEADDGRFDYQQNIYRALNYYDKYSKQTGRVVKVLESDTLKRLICDQYKLTDSYFDENIEIESTQIDGISITAYHDNPQLAADIANSMVSLTDTIFNHILETNVKTLKEPLIEKRDNIAAEMKALEDTIHALKKIGVASEIELPHLLKTFQETNDPNLKKELKKRIEITEKHQEDYFTIQLEHEACVERFSDVLSKLTELEIPSHIRTSHLYIIQKAAPSAK